MPCRILRHTFLPPYEPQSKNRRPRRVSALISLMLKTNALVTVRRKALTMQRGTESAEQKHSKQTRSEVEQSNVLEHGTPKDQSSGARVPPSAGTGSRAHGPPGRRSLQAGSGEPVRRARLVPQPEPGLRSACPGTPTSLTWASCPAERGERRSFG